MDVLQTIQKFSQNYMEMIERNLNFIKILLIPKKHILTRQNSCELSFHWTFWHFEKNNLQIIPTFFSVLVIFMGSFQIDIYDKKRPFPEIIGLALFRTS